MAWRTGIKLSPNSVREYSTFFYPVTAYLPKERESAVCELQHVMDTVSEEEMEKYRRNLKSLE